jgi:hypothetical protein
MGSKERLYGGGNILLGDSQHWELFHSEMRDRRSRNKDIK